MSETLPRLWIADDCTRFYINKTDGDSNPDGLDWVLLDENGGLLKRFREFEAHLFDLANDRMTVLRDVGFDGVERLVLLDKNHARELIRDTKFDPASEDFPTTWDITRAGQYETDPELAPKMKAAAGEEASTKASQTSE